MNNLYTEINTLLSDHIEEESNKLSIGDRYGRWTVVGEEYTIYKSNKKRRMCKFKCDCGIEKVREITNIIKGRSKSCGCYRAEQTSKNSTKHGRRFDKIYIIWRSMVNRCSNASDTNYKHYGARGIQVCDRWNMSKGGSFENFLEDMGEIPDGMTLDRIDVNGNYCKENCRWTSYIEQNYNQRIKKSNKTGITGVWYSERDGKYIAYITKNKKRIFLGSFVDIEDARKVRMEAELEYYGYNKDLK